MTATARVALVVDNTKPQKKRSKRTTPSQSFLTDKHSIYGGKAEIVRTQQSGGYWHFRMWISEESKYVRKTLKTKHLDTAVERGKTFDYKAYEAYIRKNRISVEEEDEAIQRQEIVFYMDGDRRTAKKNYLNVKASRMVAKAEDNIRAVEERRFPVGIPSRLVAGSIKRSNSY